MALTFRTGSGGKGSALTIEELDNNFRYFTGSHSITGSLDIDGNITASANISSSGTITGNFIQVDDLGYNFTKHSMRIVPSTTGVLTFSGVTSAKFEGNITASANVSASGDIFGQTGSFAGGLVLTSPNGTQYRFTTNNDGHLSLTGSVI